MARAPPQRQGGSKSRKPWPLSLLQPQKDWRGRRSVQPGRRFNPKDGRASPTNAQVVDNTQLVSFERSRAADRASSGSPRTSSQQDTASGGPRSSHRSSSLEQPPARWDGGVDIDDCFWTAAKAPAPAATAAQRASRSASPAQHASLMQNLQGTAGRHVQQTLHAKEPPWSPPAAGMAGKIGWTAWSWSGIALAAGDYRNVHALSQASDNDTTLPLFVVGFYSKDTEYMSERRWAIRAGPADSHVTLQLKFKATSRRDTTFSSRNASGPRPKVLVESREGRGETRKMQRIFPEDRYDAEGGGTHLEEDLTHRWLLHGPVEFCTEKHFYEAQPGYRGPWVRATIIRQMPGGIFEAILTTTGPGGLREVMMPGLTANQLREAKSKRPLDMPTEREIRLHVPMENPHEATLTISSDGHELEPFWKHFAVFSPDPSIRPGPTHPPFMRMMDMQVSRDRQRVQASASGPDLRLFLVDEVRAVAGRDPYADHCKWTFRVGPTTEHTLEVKRREGPPIVFVIQLDGADILEASGKEIEKMSSEFGGISTEFVFNFVLYRETVVMYHVYETNRVGDRLDSSGMVKERRPFFHNCEVCAPYVGDIRASTFRIDDLDFHELPRHVQLMQQQGPTVIDAETLRAKYGLIIPYKVNNSAPVGLAAVAHSIAGRAVPTYTDHFVGCCSKVDSNEEVSCFHTYKDAEGYSHYGLNGNGQMVYDPVEHSM